jgi:thiamine-phosphate pyrophosphorylase
MHRRQPLPRLWLMTDERQGERLWAALERLPRGSGIVFRQYDAPDRQDMFARVSRVARRRGLVLVLAGPPELARRWGAQGCHGRRGRGSASIRTAPAHDLKEIREAERMSAQLLFVSPVFATRSHPSAKPLGPVRFALLARQTRLPVIALGGMDRRRARGIAGAYGWAAIDAWTQATAD